MKQHHQSKKQQQNKKVTKSSTKTKSYFYHCLLHQERSAASCSLPDFYSYMIAIAIAFKQKYSFQAFDQAN